MTILIPLQPLSVLAPVRILSIFGTRPEAIKMAPVVAALAACESVESRICITGQHREMLDPLLSLFRLQPDYDLQVMTPGQSLAELTARMLIGLENVLRDEKPDWVLVHGDTTTALAASLAAFYAGCRVAHVEAGLRTGDLRHPWPEEMNRRQIASLADFHFAPTERARDNLLRENISPESIEVTGNTVIDALLETVQEVRTDHTWRAALAERRPYYADPRRMLLVTGHRRENLGAGMESLCRALARLAEREDLLIVFPVHLNPRVREPVEQLLGAHQNILLTEPLDYREFVAFLDRCDFIITDSGGIQEEAPALGKPVLVTRDTTERPEALASCGVQLVGTNADTIFKAAERLLDDRDYYRAVSRPSFPFGDGRAAVRIAQRLLALCEKTPV